MDGILEMGVWPSITQRVGAAAFSMYNGVMQMKDDRAMYDILEMRFERHVMA